MKLYHGSPNRNIKKFKIIPRENNTPEFGDGIYFTSNIKQAKLWSCSNSKQGAIYEIDIEINKLKGKKLESDDLFYYLSYLNRINLNDLIDDCLDELNGVAYFFGKMLKDINNFKIYGEKFNNGDIELDEFKKQTKCFEKRYNQYCFKTKEAIDLINDSLDKIYYTSRVKKNIEIVNSIKFNNHYEDI